MSKSDNRFQKVFDLLYRKRSRKKLRRVVSLLACVVMLGTTYSLMERGVTLSRSTECGTEEHIHDETCYSDILICGQEESDGHQHSEECWDEALELTCGLESSDGHRHSADCYERQLVCGKEEHIHSEACYQQDAGETVPEDDSAAAETEAALEETAAEEAAPAEAASGDSQENNSSETGRSGAGSEQETVPTYAAGKLETRVGTDDDEEYRITITYGADAKIPSDATVKAKEIQVVSSEYEDYLSKTEEALEENERLTFARFFDITILDRNGNEIQPAAAVDVKIELVASLDDAVEKTDDQGVKAVHFDEKKAENWDEVEAEVLEAEFENRDKVVTFSAEGFSVYGVVGTTIEKTVLASDGQNYKVTVTFGKNAGIPDTADLYVEEITEDTTDYRLDYDGYVSLVENALGIEEGSASYIRLFNIKIVDRDDPAVKYQPADGTTVDVKIELDDSESEKLSVVHFADGSNDGNIVENVRVDGQNVSFKADGFSVYAVVDDEIVVPESRMTVYFHDVDGNIISTIYVKNSDTAENLEQIIYDPGDGHQAGNQLFKGWIIGEKGSTEVPDYDTEDASNALDIEEIREWAESVSITDGDEYHIYPMVFQTYAVTFKDEDGVTIHSAALIFKAGDHADYTINQPYTPKLQDEAFQGWYWTSPDGSVTAKDGSTAPFANGTEVEITGNVVFTVNVPKGYWLTFSENGSGVSYTPPQFITTDSVTERPANPTRLGYTFGGWYTNQECTGNQFTFGQELNERTTLYAKWTPVASAPYTIIIWKQNISGSGYDFEESIQLNGTPNTTINTVSQQGTGNNAYARIRVGSQNQNKQYTGFHLKEFDQNVTITPEGNAVLNVYYDRTEYTMRFQVYDYTYTVSVNDNDNNPAKYGDVNGQKARVYWNNGAFRTSNSRYGTVYNGTVYTRSNGQSWQTIKEITALYEQNISDNFPIVGTNGVTYNNGERWDPQTNSLGWNEVMVFVETMPEDNVTFHLDEENRPLKTMYYYIEALPTDTENIVTREGVRYTLYNTIPARYNGVTEEDYLELDGFTKKAVAATVNGQALVLGQNTYSNTFYIYDTSRDQSIYFFYSRDSYKINYMDGSYFDGNGNLLNEPGHGQWNTSDEIYYQADISSYNAGGDDYYVPAAPAGYVFGGWCIDDACTHTYTFDKMPEGGVTVFAKWVKKQYRVFLHPNVPTSDTSFDMGGQSSSFRVNFGEKIAGGNDIHAIREDYELIGWYTDEACTVPFNFDAYVLNDTTVTAPYDKTEDTERDKYGNPTESGNRDVDRLWINNKLDLYAKWRSKIDGAPGINIQYDAVEGNGEFADGETIHYDPLTYYLDRAESTAQPASVSLDEDKQFLYWVVQRWDETAGGGEGGYVDTSEHVYPGDIFEVQKAYAREESITPAPDTPDITKQYTVQLRAEYGDRDVPDDTHIDWYPNYEENYAVHSDQGLQINEAVNIWQKQTREGYRFLGWARVPITESHSHEEVVDGQTVLKGDVLDLTKNDLFLTWHDEEGGYYTAIIDGTPRRVSRVAADEVTPYQDMYAVWEKAYTVTVKKVVVGSEEDKSIEFSFAETQNIDEIIGTDTFTLKDGDEKKYENMFPAGSHFSVAEEANADFDISVSAKYTDDDGTEHVITKGSDGNDFGNGSDIIINGNTEIIVTNTRKAKQVRIFKVDDSADPVPLEGVRFTLNGETLVTNSEGYTDVVTLDVSNDPYSLTETMPKEHYTGLSGPVDVTVGSSSVTVPEGTENVTVSAQPDAEGVYTITVVNPRKRYTVTVVKEVIGVTTDQDKGYKFTVSGLTENDDEFLLYGRDKAASGEEPAHVKQKQYAEIPYGTHFSVAESNEYTDFVTSIEIVNGEETEIKENALTTGEIIVNGNVTITVTNTRNKIPVKVVKTDQEGNPLAGAVFSGDLIGEEPVTTVITGEGDEREAIIINKESVPLGIYTLHEESAPAGYYLLPGDVTLEVKSDETGHILVAAKVGGEESAFAHAEMVDADHPELGWIVTIKNDAGVALPSAGGPGTTVIYILGSMMAVIAGGWLMLNRRRV